MNPPQTHAATVNRLVLVRHGETEGESSLRFYGATDVALSEAGRAQMREAARALPAARFDLVATSPLSRAWQSAAIVVPDAELVLMDDFREIDFGHWEGLTAQEIATRDPARSQQWRARAPGFEFPGGELRSKFRARVQRGLQQLLSSGAGAALIVTHKGVIRSIVEQLTGTALAEGEPGLAGAVHLRRSRVGDWSCGRRSSNPESLGDAPRACSS